MTKINTDIPEPAMNTLSGTKNNLEKGKGGPLEEINNTNNTDDGSLVEIYNNKNIGKDSFTGSFDNNKKKESTMNSNASGNEKNASFNSTITNEKGNYNITTIDQVKNNNNNNSTIEERVPLYIPINDVEKKVDTPIASYLNNGNQTIQNNIIGNTNTTGNLNELNTIKSNDNFDDNKGFTNSTSDLLDNTTVNTTDSNKNDFNTSRKFTPYISGAGLVLIFAVIGTFLFVKKSRKRKNRESVLTFDIENYENEGNNDLSIIYNDASIENKSKTTTYNHEIRSFPESKYNFEKMNYEPTIRANPANTPYYYNSNENYQNYDTQYQNYDPQYQNYDPQNQNYDIQYQNYDPQYQNYDPQNQNYDIQYQSYDPQYQNYDTQYQNYENY